MPSSSAGCDTGAAASRSRPAAPAYSAASRRSASGCTAISSKNVEPLVTLSRQMLRGLWNSQALGAGSGRSGFGPIPMDELAHQAGAMYPLARQGDGGGLQM